MGSNLVAAYRHMIMVPFRGPLDSMCMFHMIQARSSGPNQFLLIQIASDCYEQKIDSFGYLS